MLHSRFISLVCILCCFTCSSQSKNSKLIPDNIGLYYGIGNEHTFLFDDPDYLYKSQYFKASFSYALNSKKYQWSLAVQPQIQFIKHQLLNPFFVKPTDENFEENRLLFSRLKSMQLYALQFEISVRRQLLKKLAVSGFFAVGPAVIDTKTERLAKGFTFIENLGLGLHYTIKENLFLGMRPTFGHISNARLQLPNSGYNVMNLEIGVSWKL